MTLPLGLLLVLAAFGAPGARDAERARFEIRIFGEMPKAHGRYDEASECLTSMRSAAVRRPLFVVRAADVETYIWKTQRITLTREASARLDASLEAAPAWMRVSPRNDLERASELVDRVFEVRLDGELLYRGLLTDLRRATTITCPCPVIHPEWVEGQAVFHLLPFNMYPGEFGEFEETVGAGRILMRLARQPAPVAVTDGTPETSKIPGDAERDSEEAALVRKYRPIMRDPRVEALFAGLGKLVPEPPPPTTPAEIRIALAQTDAAVQTWFALGSDSIGPVLKDGFVLRVLSRPASPTSGWYSPLEGFRNREIVTFERPPSSLLEEHGKQEMLESMAAGQWKLPFYAVLAADPVEIAGDRRATIRSLIAMRGRLGPKHEIARIVLSTRHYEFNPPAWQLVDETHQECADDSPGPWRLLTEDRPSLVDPCWPLRQPTPASELAPPR